MDSKFAANQHKIVLLVGKVIGMKATTCIDLLNLKWRESITQLIKIVCDAQLLNIIW